MKTAPISPDELTELARTGIRLEISRLQSMLDTLTTNGTSARHVTKSRKLKRTMSAASRKAIGKRMKEYWAERRAKQNKTK